MILARISILLVAGLPVLAQDAHLDALRSLLVPMRSVPVGEGGPRGATPQWTTAKHELRAWVESQLANFPERADPKELERKLNAELEQAGFFCGAGRIKCPDWTWQGFLRAVKLDRVEAFLLLRTGVGIECGFDESAYLYESSGTNWRLTWENERNTYTEKEYLPQTIESVLVSPYNRGNEYLVMILGSESWCTSNWHRVYYRIDRMGPNVHPAPLVEEAPLAYLGSHDPPIQGSIGLDDALVEFTVRSIDSGVHSRPAVRHYRIDHNDVQRLDPVALSPRDFVDEWLTSDWRQALGWTESSDRRMMADVHAKRHTDSVSGVFLFPTMHCPVAPDLWQVGVDFNPRPIIEDRLGDAVYFLVRWRPPYRFSMAAMRDKPFPGCGEEDRDADEIRRTLFPVQEWR